MKAERRFEVMGSSAHLIVTGADSEALAEWAQGRLAALHRRWSRFDPASEVAQLNAARGKPTIVSADTYLVIRQAVEAWHATGGRFDPTIHDALCALGYRASFSAMAPDQPPGPAPDPVPGCAGIELDDALRAVTLPPDVRLDLGGIGKGAAADLVTAELLARGASGACVNVGGDVRVEGVAPTVAGWIVELACPGARSRPVERVALARGAVCTTSRMKRHWRQGAREMHHLIDPARAQPARGLCSVTVVAARATQAEVLSKTAFVAGAADGPGWIAEHGCAGIVVADDGSTIAVGPIEEMAA